MLHSHSVEASGLLDLISSRAIFLDCPCVSKSRKSALHSIAQLFAPVCGQDSEALYFALHQREQVGSTAMGQGVAIPHARINGLDHLYAGLFRFRDLVDFDAPDHRGVDLFAVILTPEDAGADHLQALARLARVMRDAEFRELLRNAQDIDGVIGLLSRSELAA